MAITQIQQLVQLIINQGFRAQVSLEGYSFLDHHFDFATEIIRVAITSGANSINCPDTIGGACEHRGADYSISNMIKHADIMLSEFPEKDITWSIHCHNDFGLALGNSMNAVFKGPARQIEGCIYGVGERAGNVALEQCSMIIKHFGPLDNPKNPLYTHCDISQLKNICNFVSENMSRRAPNTPIVGSNIARHSSGGHTNAIINEPLAYQPFDPSEEGAKGSMVYGPLSGSNHMNAIVSKDCLTSLIKSLIQAVNQVFVKYSY